jgi:hypothetical protein
VVDVFLEKFSDAGLGFADIHSDNPRRKNPMIDLVLSER